MSWPRHLGDVIVVAYTTRSGDSSVIAPGDAIAFSHTPAKAKDGVAIVRFLSSKSEVCIADHHVNLSMHS